MTSGTSYSRRKFFRTFGGAAAAISATALLAACGAPPAATNTPAPAAEPTTAAAAPTATTAAAIPEPTATSAPVTEPTAAPVEEAVPTAMPETSAGFRGEVIISISNVNIPESAITALGEAYKEGQPGIDVVWEPPAGDYTQWLNTQLAAGDPRPDLVTFNGIVTPKSAFNFDTVRYSLNPYTGAPWDEALDWQFLLSYNAQGKRDTLYTRAVHATMWFYNSEIFEEAGVEPPTTWEGLIDVGSTLKAKNYIPISVANWMVQGWLAEVYFDQYHVNWVEEVRSREGDWNFKEDLDGQFTYDANDPWIHNKYTLNFARYWGGIRDGVLRFDTPEYADIVAKKKLVFPALAAPDMWVVEDNYTPFLQQKAAIMVGGGWHVPQLERDFQSMTPERMEELGLAEDAQIRPFTWDYFDNPPMEGPLVKSGVRAIESAVGEYVSIVEKDQAKTDLSVDFVMFWLSKAGYQPYVDALGMSDYVPGGPLMVKDVTEPEDYQRWFGNTKLIGNCEASYVWLHLWLGGNPEKQQDDAYTAVLDGKIPPEEFGATLQKVLDDNFGELLEYNGLTEDDLDNPAKQPGT